MPRKSSKSSELELLDWFVSCGYLRQVDPVRRANDGQLYKKGWEVRFTLETIVEAQTVRDLVLDTGLRPGKVYPKHRRYLLPIYGREAVEWFLERLPRGRTARELGFGESGERLARRPRR